MASCGDQPEIDATLMMESAWTALHMRKRQPHHPDGLDQIPLQCASPIVIGAIGNVRSSTATTHVVDQHVDAAVGRDGSGLTQPLHRVR
jgi:hypothetical protein